MVKLVTITPDAEKLIAYCARVSSPNQSNEKIDGLLKYCINHKHWSIFEQASATFEIETSLAIATQILRHKSFNYQQFSQRYAAATEFEVIEARRQDTKNRQNSTPDLSPIDIQWFEEAQNRVKALSISLYEEALNRGIAKESARFLLPQMTRTRLYMTGNIRSFIHYFDVRCADGVQKEHKDIAVQMKSVLKSELPIIAEALKW